MKYKYEAINQLNTFEFHDAIIDNIKIIDKKIIFDLECVNITKKNLLNTYPTDMKLGQCRLLFEEVENVKATILGYKSYDENKNIIRCVDNISLNEKEALTELENYKNRYSNILYLKETKTSNSRYNALVELNEHNIMDLSFSYKTSIISWNDFADKAWYVDFNKEKNIKNNN